MGFFVIKCLADSEQVLFKNINEERAKQIVKTLVEEHAEVMLLQNSSLSEQSALAKSELIFKIVYNFKSNKRRPNDI